MTRRLGFGARLGIAILAMAAVGFSALGSLASADLKTGDRGSIWTEPEYSPAPFIAWGLAGIAALTTHVPDEPERLEAAFASHLEPLAEGRVPVRARLERSCRGQVAPGRRRTYAYGRLASATADSIVLTDLVDVGRLSMAPSCLEYVQELRPLAANAKAKRQRGALLGGGLCLGFILFEATCEPSRPWIPGMEPYEPDEGLQTAFYVIEGLGVMIATYLYFAPSEPEREMRRLALDEQDRRSGLRRSN
jgi:hypothetical protein